MTRHLRPVKPPASMPQNELNRRVALMHKLLARVDQEPPLVVADAERIVLLQARLGDIADAFLFAHTDIDGEVEDMVVTLLRWLLDRERDRAA